MSGKGKYVVAPGIALLVSVLYFWIPFRKLCGKKMMAEDSIEGVLDPVDDDFYKQVMNFNDDYFRSNPVICHKSWEKWLNTIERKI